MGSLWTNVQGCLARAVYDPTFATKIANNVTGHTSASANAVAGLFIESSLALFLLKVKNMRMAPNKRTEIAIIFI
jgi:hypothetical protein